MHVVGTAVFAVSTIIGLPTVQRTTITLRDSSTSRGESQTGDGFRGGLVRLLTACVVSLVSATASGACRAEATVFLFHRFGEDHLLSRQRAELGWRPARWAGDFFYRCGGDALKKRGDRLAVSAREKGSGRGAIRFRLIVRQTPGGGEEEIGGSSPPLPDSRNFLKKAYETIGWPLFG